MPDKNEHSLWEEEVLKEIMILHKDKFFYFVI